MKEQVTLRKYLEACRILREDRDIAVDAVEGACIAYCGADLTPEGEERFKDALDLPMDGATVISNDNDDYDDVNLENESSKLVLAWELLCSLAGYCSAEDYDKWFIDSEI